LKNVAFNGLSDSLKREIERFRYKTKLFEVVRHSVKSPKEIKSTKLFIRLQELHKLRNSFAHPQDLEYPVDITTEKTQKRERLVKIHIRDKNDCFPVSKMQRNFMCVGYQDGKIAKDIVCDFLKWLVKNLSKDDKETLFCLNLKGNGLDKMGWKKGRQFRFIISGKGEYLVDFPIFKQKV